MGRPPAVAGGRHTAFSTKLSVGEAAAVDAARGSLSRAEYLRWALLLAANVTQGNVRQNPVET